MRTMKALHAIAALLMLLASTSLGSAFLMDSEQNYVEPPLQRQDRAGSQENYRSPVSKCRRMVLAEYFSYPSW